MTRLRVVLLGVVLVALGVLVLFFPQSQRVDEAWYPCGSAAAPSSSNVCGAHDGTRFAAVLLMTGGVLTSITPRCGCRSVPRMSGPGSGCPNPGNRGERTEPGGVNRAAGRGGWST